MTGATAATINGLPAIVIQIRVAVRDGSVPLSTAAYDGGNGQAYHLIIISPPVDADGAAIAALFRSFRLLSQQEAAALYPRFVRTIKTARGDTVDTLSRHVADAYPTALFKLLNGRLGVQPIRTGETVRIVTYADAR